MCAININQQLYFAANEVGDVTPSDNVNKTKIIHHSLQKNDNERYGLIMQHLCVTKRTNIVSRMSTVVEIVKQNWNMR